MKFSKILLAIMISSLAQASMATSKEAEAPKAAETKKVCITKTDPKTNKSSEQCKEVKVHKKLEGTKVPAK